MIALYPIKPVYVNRILAGEKVYELRKRLPKKALSNVVIYSTSPESMIVAFADVKEIHQASPAEMWELVSEKAGISEEGYYEYFGGSKMAYAIEIENVKRFSNPLKITVLGEKMSVPQSFCYLDKMVFNKIKRRKWISI